jgi:hypothetical protein
MLGRRALPFIAAFLSLAAVAAAAQFGRAPRPNFQNETGRPNRWAQYEPEMQDPVPDPPDAWVEGEFAVGRLRFHSAFDGFRRGGWGNDANKADRLFSAILRRMTRIDVRSVEQIVDVDSDDVFNWPWLFASHPGSWVFSDEEAARMKKYFDRGGFLMVDDFHNETEWAGFAAGIARIVPNGHFVELSTADPIMHTAYDINELYQVSGLNILQGMPYERGGIVPHWRGVVDEKGRIVVAIDFDMDVGDSWEWADYPPYPEKLSSLGMRMGVNYVMYAMTH